MNCNQCQGTGGEGNYGNNDGCLITGLVLILKENFITNASGKI
jgi:hypothetical protein